MRTKRFIEWGADTKDEKLVDTIVKGIRDFHKKYEILPNKIYYNNTQKLDIGHIKIGEIDIPLLASPIVLVGRCFLGFPENYPDLEILKRRQG